METTDNAKSMTQGLAGWNGGEKVTTEKVLRGFLEENGNVFSKFRGRPSEQCLGLARLQELGEKMQKRITHGKGFSETGTYHEKKK